jgi:CRP/FNR family transcriptional regulator, cyclic AMP receptor protein
MSRTARQRSPETMTNRLARHPFLRGLPDDYLGRLAGFARVEQFPAGTYLLRERHPASCFYLLEEGRVALEIHGAQRGQIVIETIEAGECLGWSWLFAPYRWHFSGRAIDSVRSMVLDGVQIRSLCETDHSFGYEMMKRTAGVMMQRLQATRLGLLDVYTDGR